MSTLSVYDAAEPCGTTLEVNARYTITGLVNAEVLKIPYATGKVLQRVPVITPKLSQFVLEIWNSQPEFEPIFSSNWKTLQLIFCKGAVYHGISDMGTKNRKIHVFRLSQRDANITRFIWLSSDRPNFWDDPLSIKDMITDIETSEIQVKLAKIVIITNFYD